MPKVKPLGLVKHMDEWEKKKRREAAEHEKLEKIARKTAENKAKAKLNTSKKTLSRSKRGRRKTVGSGVSLKSLFGKRR